MWISIPTITINHGFRKWNCKFSGLWVDRSTDTEILVIWILFHFLDVLKTWKARSPIWQKSSHTDIQTQTVDSNSGSITTKPIHVRFSFLDSTLLLMHKITNNYKDDLKWSDNVTILKFQFSVTVIHSKERGQEMTVPKWPGIFRSRLIMSLGTWVHSIFTKNTILWVWKLFIVTNESCMGYFIFLVKNTHCQNSTKWPQASQSGIYQVLLGTCEDTSQADLM